MNILHFETNRMIRKSIKETSESLGYLYFYSENQTDGFRILENENIELIIVAVELKDETSEKILIKLSQSCFSQIPILVLTTFDDLCVREKYFSHGIVDYIIYNKYAIPRLKRYMETIKLVDRYGLILKRAKIAVLDDSNFSLYILKKMLEGHGIKNVTYYSDPKAFQEDQDKYDIYIIDLVLPGVSCEELVYELRKSHSKAIIMIISAINNHNTISHMLIAGADDYILKPIDSQIILARMRSHLKTMKMIERIELQNRQLDTLSKIDSLTQIPNRMHLMNRLDEEVKRAKRLNYPLSIVLYDIDNFKLINDTYGHIEGDKVLQEVAEMMKMNIRETDFVGRYGGEEFMMIFPGTTEEQAVIVANKIRSIIQTKYELTKKYNLTISGGISSKRNLSKKKMIHRADKMLYEAKSIGKNKICS